MDSRNPFILILFIMILFKHVAHIHACPFVCNCTYVTTNQHRECMISCEEQGLTSIPDFTSLALQEVTSVDLRLNKNQIRHVLATSLFSIRGKLKSLEIQENRNKISINPKALDMFTQSLQSFKVDNLDVDVNEALELLSPLTKLSVIKISTSIENNIKLKSFYYYFRMKLPPFHSVKRLELHHCGIEAIAEESFYNFYSLRVLSLAHNKLKTFPQALHFLLCRLDVLDLESNEITSIKFSNFPFLCKLRILNLKDNKLFHIDHFTLGKCPMLSEVSFSTNVQLFWENASGVFSGSSSLVVDLTNTSVLSLENFNSNNIKKLIINGSLISCECNKIVSYFWKFDFRLRGTCLKNSKTDVDILNFMNECLLNSLLESRKKHPISKKSIPGEPENLEQSIKGNDKPRPPDDMDLMKVGKIRNMFYFVGLTLRRFAKYVSKEDDDGFSIKHKIMNIFLNKKAASGRADRYKPKDSDGLKERDDSKLIRSLRKAIFEYFRKPFMRKQKKRKNHSESSSSSGKFTKKTDFESGSMPQSPNPDPTFEHFYESDHKTASDDSSQLNFNDNANAPSSPPVLSHGPHYKGETDADEQLFDTTMSNRELDERNKETQRTNVIVETSYCVTKMIRSLIVELSTRDSIAENENRLICNSMENNHNDHSHCSAMPYRVLCENVFPILQTLSKSRPDLLLEMSKELRKENLLDDEIIYLLQKASGKVDKNTMLDIGVDENLQSFDTQDEETIDDELFHSRPSETFSQPQPPPPFLPLPPCSAPGSPSQSAPTELPSQCSPIPAPPPIPTTTSEEILKQTPENPPSLNLDQLSSNINHHQQQQQTVKGQQREDQEKPKKWHQQHHDYLNQEYNHHHHHRHQQQHQQQQQRENEEKQRMNQEQSFNYHGQQNIDNAAQQNHQHQLQKQKQNEQQHHRHPYHSPPPLPHPHHIQQKQQYPHPPQLQTKNQQEHSSNMHLQYQRKVNDKQQGPPSFDKHSSTARPRLQAKERLSSPATSQPDLSQLSGVVGLVIGVLYTTLAISVLLRLSCINVQKMWS